MPLMTFAEAIADSNQFSKRHLLLGNGFSIACRADIFHYGSLFAQADFSQVPEVVAVFDALGTQDFEAAIRALENAARILPAYVPHGAAAIAKMLEHAAALKEILVQTIAGNHPHIPPDIPDQKFWACRQFLSHFLASDGQVFTLNYDLLLYWTLMHDDMPFDEPIPLATNDGFGNDEDDPDADYVVWQGESGAHDARVHFLHGALHLFDSGAELKKYTWIRKGVPLVEQARAAIAADAYKPEQAFAELRGISFRVRVVEMVRQVPERAKSIFGNFRPQARQLEPIPAQANTQNEQRRAVERYARALGDIGTMQAQGLPVLPHQKAALAKAGKALEAIRPHAATDLAKALDRRPELIAEAAGGRSQEAMRAMQDEAAVRTDPALRTERFVSDWQGLSTARKQLEQQGDRAGAALVSAKLNELAKGLERDPQVEGLLRGKTRELGIDPKPERSIANELTATLTRERTRAFDIGI